MAGLGVTEQLRIIAWWRSRLFINSLRSARGRLNLVSRSLAGLLVAAAGVGGAFALAVAAYGITLEGNLVWLAVAFWLVFLFWQLFPLMATAFNESIDTSSLLRFPLSYPAYLAVRLAFGAMDIATGLGVSWSFGLLAGVSAARPGLLPWTFLVGVCFVAFNLLFARVVFVWIEDWLSSRRSKEILGVMFLLLLVGFQVAGPFVGRYSRRSGSERLPVVEKLLPLERILPPGLAEVTLASAANSSYSLAAASVVALAGYSAAIFLVLELRLRSQYYGRRPGGGEGRRSEQDVETVRPGWKIPGLEGPLTAIYQKELCYFSRSGPMLFTLIMPLVVVLLMWGGRKGMLSGQSGFLLPVGAAYCLLLLTNIVYNSFGGEGEGVQFFFFSPVSFRQIALAKNLAQSTVLLIDFSILWLGILAIYHPPRFRVVALTLAWYLFAVPLNFSVGNWLSVSLPKRIDYSTFGRQRAAPTTILVSLGVQLGAIAVGAAAVYVAKLEASLWVATFILLLLAIPSILGYLLLLGRIEQIALARREVLAAELCRAS